MLIINIISLMRLVKGLNNPITNFRQWCSKMFVHNTAIYTKMLMSTLSQVMSDFEYFYTCGKKCLCDGKYIKEVLTYD